MDRGDVGPGGTRPVVVRIPVEPVEAAVEADAVDAAARADKVVVRGPLFGVAEQGAGDGQRWRVVVEVTSGCPQQARDRLNSMLWFRAKDGARDRAQRRALLAAVARLEAERVDELAVAGSHYRIVRAEEYAVSGPDGIEQPRPTDPEPPSPTGTARYGARGSTPGSYWIRTHRSPPPRRSNRWRCAGSATWAAGSPRRCSGTRGRRWTPTRTSCCCPRRSRSSSGPRRDGGRSADRTRARTTPVGHWTST